MLCVATWLSGVDVTWAAKAMMLLWRQTAERREAAHTDMRRLVAGLASQLSALTVAAGGGTSQQLGSPAGAATAASSRPPSAAHGSSNGAEAAGGGRAAASLAALAARLPRAAGGAGPSPQVRVSPPRFRPYLSDLLLASR